VVSEQVWPILKIVNIIMGKENKKAWLRELEEINQTIQAEYVGLRRLLQ
jgi:hypothetical protein